MREIEPILRSVISAHCLTNENVVQIILEAVYALSSVTLDNISRKTIEALGATANRVEGCTACYKKKQASCAVQYRSFPHSNTQWHWVEVRVVKNRRNVWKCPPQPHSGSTVCTHWSRMQERSIGMSLSWLKSVTTVWQKEITCKLV